jgi:dephospho-CoA kinase
MKTFSQFLEEELELLDEGVYDPGILKAIFTAGGPGSGKSFMAKMAGVGKGNRHGVKVVNSDAQYEKLLKDAGMAMTPENIFSKKGQEIRGHAKELTKKMESGYLNGRLGLLIDGTGKDFDKVKKTSEKLKGLGYDSYMLFVNTSLEVAQKRNMERERSLDPEEVEQMWRQVQNNIGKFQNYFGRTNFILVDNNSAGEDIFQKIWKQVNSLVTEPVKNPVGKQWVKSELEKKKR